MTIIEKIDINKEIDDILKQYGENFRTEYSGLYRRLKRKSEGLKVRNLK